MDDGCHVALVSIIVTRVWNEQMLQAVLFNWSDNQRGPGTCQGCAKQHITVCGNAAAAQESARRREM